jgi:hypothetical protein
VKKVWKAGRDQSFFFSKGFIGSDSDMNSVIQRVTKLTETERGLECVMQLVLDLHRRRRGRRQRARRQRRGVDQRRADHPHRPAPSRNEVEGRDGRAGDRHPLPRAVQGQALVLAGRQARRADVPDALGPRLHAQARRLDPHRLAASFAALRRGRGGAVSNRIIYAGSATSEGTLTTSDKMSWAGIVRARKAAERKRLRPIREGGKSYYCC